MVTIQSLISDFHELSGITAVEKHKNFQNYLKIVQETLNDQNQDDFFAGLQPKDNFQEIFRIDLLSKFKRNEELLNVLKSGNREHIGRLLKNFQFFSEILSKIDANSLVNDLLPNTSFIIRTKIVNRIPKTVKNEKLIEEYFTAIENKYGVRLALVVLPGCSIEFIKKIVDKYNPDLSSRHLLEIYKKDKSFLEDYLSLIKSKDGNVQINIKYFSIIKYLMKNDIDLFWKIQKKYKFDFKSGRNTTEKLILSNKEFLNDGYKCLDAFHTNTLYKTILKHDKSNDFLLSFYPEAPFDFFETDMTRYSAIYRILKYFNEDKLFKIIQDLFEKKYSKNILDHETLFSHDFLKLVPIENRVIIAKKLVEKSDDYIYLLHPNESLPLIKNLLQNSSSVEQRSKLFEELFKIMEINNDENSRLEVIQFVYERYRNDTKSINAFITKINDGFTLNKFNECELKLLYKLLGYLKISDLSVWLNRRIFSRLLLVLIKNKRNYDDYLFEYLKVASTDEFYYSDLFENDLNGNLIEVLEKCIEILERFKDNKNVRLKATQQIIMHLSHYKGYRKNKIPLDKYLHLLDEFFDEKNGNYYNIEISLIYHIRNFKNKNIDKYFWAHYNDTISYLLSWYLKNDIKQVEENIEKILNQRPHRINKNFLDGFKKYATPSLKEKIISYVKSNLSYDDFKSANYLIRILSHIDSEKYLKITEPFMPDNNKLIDESVTNKKEIQESIIYSLADLDVDNKYELIKKVCVGDYLKYGLHSLYKIAYNHKENEINSILNDLIDSPISLKKHSMFLARHLIPIQDAWNFIDSMEKIEQNPSIRNGVFIKSINLFIETPTENNWLKIKEYFNIVNVNDTSVIDFMIKSTNKIPSKFRNDYLQSVYGILKKCKRKGIEKKIIELSKIIPHSSTDESSFNFIEEIIETILNDLFSNSRDCILWDLILNLNPEKWNHFLCFAFEHLKTILSPSISGYSKHRLPLNDLLLTFCYKLLQESEETANERKDNCKELINNFILQWNFFPKYCLIESEMFLQITAAFFESDFDLEKLATPLSKLLHLYVKEYDFAAIESFYKQVERLFQNRYIQKERGHEMIKKLIEINDDKVNCIFAVLFLPHPFPLELNKHFKWVPIIKVIERFIGENGKDSKMVMLYYDRYLETNREEYIWVGDQEFPSVCTKL